MDVIEKAIRGALEKGDADDRAFREKVYRSAFAALERALQANPDLAPEIAGKRRSDLQAKIAEMPDEDRALAARIHEIVTTTVPDLVPRTFYGMPAYAKNGKVVCFFQAKAKFKVRYSTLGFQHDARLDEGEIWPVAFAVTSLTPAGEKQIAELVKKAAG